LEKGLTRQRFGAYVMRCKSCGSEKFGDLNGEIAMYFSGLKNRNEPSVWAFPQVVVCLNCGTAEFDIAEDQLRLLGRGPSAG
jgi:predicted nucleic-acid-binding Zn-ribbon protein